ncbi:MAG TPA: hypothetical protein VFH58_13525 [Acidimicrobiales bacterium]|nr:hypothetical protein [Acidimicrobiales bacterium]
MSRGRAGDLAAGYEALRTRATGGLPAESPRGMAILLTQGLPTWIRAWAAPTAVSAPVVPAAPTTGSGLGGEMVRLLTEMVLGGGRRLAIS